MKKFLKIYCQIYEILGKGVSSENYQKVFDLLCPNLKGFGAEIVQEKTALFQKLDSLKDADSQLAGKIGTVVDLVNLLPVEIWFCDNPRAFDPKFESEILKLVVPKTLLGLDRGFEQFNFWLQLIENQVDFITRLKQRAAIHRI